MFSFKTTGIVTHIKRLSSLTAKDKWNITASFYAYMKILIQLLKFCTAYKATIFKRLVK